MCGIAGVAGEAAQARAEDAAAMAGALRHRGPDDSGRWSGASRDGRFAVGLGHARLSVLDLSPRGRQPMTSADGPVTVAYNGEIYNFEALRRELERSGHTFHTGTDTEVLLAAYLAWGERAWHRFVGMFAFALWDGRHDRLLLVRDRLGIKPLLYQDAGGTLLFASEVGALRRHPAFDPTIDAAALGRYLAFGYFTAPETVYRATRRLPPGSVLRWHGGRTEVERWWSPSDAVPEPGGGSGHELERALFEAIRDRLVADVPVGALLSGGIDSSTVVALMREVSTDPVRTFSIGFEDPAFDESAHAREVAEHLGTEHEELRVRRDDAVEVARSLPDLFDEPFADPSAIPTVLVSRLARRRVTVALTGDGGDELFGGYSRYRRLHGLRGLWAAPRLLRRMAAAAIGLAPHPALRRHAALLSRPDAAHGTEGLTARLPVPGARLVRGAGEPEARPAYLEAFAAARGGPVERCMAADLATWLPDDVLVKLDRASMSVGLEGRVPLLDHRVVAAARALHPGELRRGGRAKAPLRAILDPRVPSRLIDRPKSGFGIPLHKLLAPELAAWRERYLAPGRLAEDGVLAPGPVSDLVARIDPSTGAGARALWHLLCFQRWFARHHRGENLA